ncbi:MAG: hypothetical protein RL033_5908 [Pseudomonadota bacterium]
MVNTSRFAPDQIQAQADQALRTLEHAGADAALLVEEWVKAGNAAAVQATAEHGSGAARKSARRGLNVLKSRGVSIPDSTPRVGRVAADPVATRQAWLLPPDPNGVVGIVLAEPLPSGSYQACSVFFRENRELLRVQSGQLSLSKLEKNMRDSLGGAGYGPVPVPWAWAQWRLAERRAWHSTRKVAEPLGWMGAEQLLEGHPSEAPPHPFEDAQLKPAPEAVEALARNSGPLHQWPEFRSWLPGERALQEMLLNIGRKFGPTPPTAKEEIDPIVREQVTAATDRYFTPERRAVLANRMLDSGLSVLHRLGEDSAKHLQAVIQTIRGAGLITNPPSDVGFLSAFFDKAMAVLAAQQGGRLRVPIPAPTDTPSAEAEADPLGPDSPAPTEAAAAAPPA